MVVLLEDIFLVGGAFFSAVGFSQYFLRKDDGGDVKKDPRINYIDIRGYLPSNEPTLKDLLELCEDSYYRDYPRLYGGG